MSAHAFLAPSSADRWFHCPGSAWMESQFPDLTDPSERAEGEACHWLMQQVLTTEIAASSLVGQHAPNGSVITQTMAEAVETLREDIESKLGPGWRQAVNVERRIPAISRAHRTACWGTPDVWAWAQWAPGRFVLYVWDLKYGFKRVEIFENKQLILYAIGILEEFNIDDQTVGVELVVCQPRAYHPDGPVRSWAVPQASDFRGIVNQLASAGEKATSPNPPCKPKPSACENCRARHSCDALQEAEYRGMDIARQAVPRELTAEAAGLELAMLADTAALIEARKSGLEELVKHKLARGERVPYWRMGPGRGKTEWTKPIAEVLALGRILKIDLAKPPQAITPLQAKDKGLPESMMGAYSQSVAGATKLTRDDNTSVRRIFSR